MAQRDIREESIKHFECGQSFLCFQCWERSFRDPYIIISEENFIYCLRSNVKYGPNKTAHSSYTFLLTLFWYCYSSIKYAMQDPLCQNVFKTLWNRSSFAALYGWLLIISYWARNWRHLQIFWSHYGKIPIVCIDSIAKRVPLLAPFLLWRLVLFLLCRPSGGSSKCHEC